MGALSAAIESNGWVLAIRGNWPATSGAWNFGAADRVNGQFLLAGIDQFPLDPSGIPKISVEVTSAGYDRTLSAADKATANAARPRTLVATKALRKPHPDHALVDETDNGDGTRTLRFALSDRVYDTCVVSAVTLAAGWKAGEGAAVLPCVNQSLRTAPIPISRWAVAPYQLVRGTAAAPSHLFDVEVVVATHHPEHFGADSNQALAAMRLMATDGTTAKYYWITSTSASARPDGLLCWRASIDLSGLNPGVITIQREEFPWVGLSRATGVMTVAGHSTDREAGFSSAWATPLTVCYDPTGSRYNIRYFHIDTDSTNATMASHVNVQAYTSLAAAKAAPLTAKAQNISVASKMLREQSWGLTAANGLTPLNSRSCDYCVLVLKSGQVHGYVTDENISTSANLYAQEGYLIICGDPDNSEARNQTILRTKAAQSGRGNVTRLWLRDLTLEMGQAAFLNSSSTHILGERITIRGKTGYENATVAQSPSYSSGQVSYWFETSSSAYVSQQGGIIVRNSHRSRNIGFVTAIGLTMGLEAGVPRNAGLGFGLFGGSDNMIWNSRLLAWDSAFISVNATSAEPGGNNSFGNPQILRRLAVVNTLVEGVHTALFQLGETNNNTMRDSIWDGSVIVGQRMNFHNQPPVPLTASGTTVTMGLMDHGLGVGDTITVSGCVPAGYNGTYTVANILSPHRVQYVVAANPGAATAWGQVVKPGDVTQRLMREGVANTGNVIRNCVVDDNGTKHDVWSRDGSLTQSWEVLYGVGYRHNALGNRDSTGAQDFQHAFYGVGSEVSVSYDRYGDNWYGFMADGTDNGGGTNSGLGDYRPSLVAESRLIGQATLSTTDGTLDNATRGRAFSIGAYAAFPAEPAGPTLEIGNGWHCMTGLEAELVAGVVEAAVISPWAGGMTLRGSTARLRAYSEVVVSNGGRRRVRVSPEERRVSTVSN